MNERKITISRSFSRTWQIENYEPAQFFSSRNMEVPADTPMKEQQEISEELFSLAMTDVINSKMDYDDLRENHGKGVDAKTFRDMQDKIGTGKPGVLIEDWEDCSPAQHKILNEFKKFHKRSDEHKAKRIPRDN